MNNRNASESDRGAVLVHVAIVILALLAFSAFVVDYGALWAARRQAQNVADSAALAGAVSLAFDSSDTTTSGPAFMAATSVAQAGIVWGATPGNVVLVGTEADGVCPTGQTGTCLRVNVYRDGTNGSTTMSTFFGPLFGRTQQGIRATATAIAADANASNCLKPFAVADKWIEHNPVDGPWTPTSTYDPTGPNPDVYVPQDGTNPGSGFTLANDSGTALTLKTGSPHDAINPGWFQPVDLTGGGGSQYSYNIGHCAGVTIKVGDMIPKETGNKIGPTKFGVQDLIALDPGASWDGTKVVGSCIATGNCPGGATYTISPRVVALPVFDLGLYWNTRDAQTGQGDIKVVNILGFFVTGMNGNDVMGVLMANPGLIATGGGNVAPGSAFNKAIILIR